SASAPPPSSPPSSSPASRSSAPAASAGPPPRRSHSAPLGSRASQRSGPSELTPLHVLEVERLAVDAFRRRGDPAGDLAALVARHHQAPDVLAVGGARQPVGDAPLVLRRGDQVPVDVEGHAGVKADGAVEALRGQAQPFARRARALDAAVPLVDGALA